MGYDSARRLRMAVGIPSTGRSDILAATVPLIEKQTRLPEKIVICTLRPSDVPDGLHHLAIPVSTKLSSSGLAKQRNDIIKELYDFDILVFLDDDFLMAPNYLAEVERLFLEHEDVMVATGNVLLDGIGSRGIGVAEGSGLLKKLLDDPETRPETMTNVYNGYGCNMTVRLDGLRRNDIWFDENLPLYCWLEDVDLSRLLAQHGRVVKSNTLRGIHLGVKTGRTSGIKLGYSQIANPYYLARKGTMLKSKALAIAAKNVVANLVKSLAPEAWVDRKGRLRGNLLALRDLLAGRISPSRVLVVEKND
ncbi:glycosyltransferase family 2 protein [Phyllobacterium sp. 0TCS1.6C]|uniref:glycosyltransferase family 2 protein n=1 Tax=unclassified Phyllobacterium TaxID=2638441 RepID=UPI002263B75F|nr:MULTISPECIES: glycosyltransferase family 2 protein [unclassified Phyllobacterium]MCX8279971.1 glycosyltransferase family 2 protein [Phyllobacterium sp. 0TCS1.6C]MCX8296138.1 glycosyltransferase family 2 protein [Phyllobacterium sp. 0TCS1.6A]